jgi:hypothetical protein
VNGKGRCGFRGGGIRGKGEAEKSRVRESAVERIFTGTH